MLKKSSLSDAKRTVQVLRLWAKEEPAAHRAPCRFETHFLAIGGLSVSERSTTTQV